MEKENEMRRYLVLAGLFLLAVGMALAQGEYPKFDTSPAFMFIRTSPNFTNAFVLPNGQVVTGNNEFNCAGGGGTFTYNVNRALGVGADLGACKFFGNTIGLGNAINGYQFTYLFGPRLILRNSSPFTPFFDLEFGADKLSASCKDSAAECLTRAGSGTYSKNAFAMTVGGGFDIKISKKLSLRPIQAEYLYTRFGNDCALSVCSNNNNQNSFRLKSGIVMAWGQKSSK
jgi:opacity protein-like surface antigen